MTMDSQTVKIGQIYRIKADERNDITPKAGMSATLETLLEGEFCGEIAQDDFANIVSLLKMSPRETFVHLRTFGLI